MLTPLAVSPAFSITGRIRASTLTGTISFFQLPPDHSNPLFFFRTRYTRTRRVREYTKVPVHSVHTQKCTVGRPNTWGDHYLFNTAYPAYVFGTFGYRGTFVLCTGRMCFVCRGNARIRKEKGGHTFLLPSEPQRSYEKPRWLHIWGPRCLFALCFPFYLWRHSLLVPRPNDYSWGSVPFHR